MTTIAEAREAVYEAWTDGWGTTTLFVFENEQFKEPAGTPVPWCRVSFRNLDGYQHTLGGIGHRLYNRDAKVYVQVMAPVNKGMHAGSELAQQARALFEGVRIGELVGFGGVVKEAKPDGKWYVTLVEVAFQYYEVK